MVLRLKAVMDHGRAGVGVPEHASAQDEAGEDQSGDGDRWPLKLHEGELKWL